MKIQEHSRNVESYGVEGQNEFQVKQSKKMFKILSDGLYSDKIGSIIRELACNARDAHVAAGKADVPILIKVPTKLEPEFAVEDWGTGLSPEEVDSIYTTYFESTKSDSNDFIGAFGLGSKSPFSYANNFNVTVYHDSVEYIYSMHISAKGTPTCAKLGNRPTERSNGVRVSFDVREADIEEFCIKAMTQLQYFEVQPKYQGLQDETKIPKIEYLLKNNRFGVRKRSRGHSYEDEMFWPHRSDLARMLFPSITNARHRAGTDDYNLKQNKLHAVQGGVAYQVTEDCLDEMQRQFSDNEVQYVSWLLNKPVTLFFEVGDLDVTASRESLSYDATTVANIAKMALAFKVHMTTYIQKKFAGKYTNQKDLQYAVYDYLASNSGSELVGLISMSDATVIDGIEVCLDKQSGYHKEPREISLSPKDKFSLHSFIGPRSHYQRWSESNHGVMKNKGQSRKVLCRTYNMQNVFYVDLGKVMRKKHLRVLFDNLKHDPSFLQKNSGYEYFSAKPDEADIYVYVFSGSDEERKHIRETLGGIWYDWKYLETILKPKEYFDALKQPEPAPASQQASMRRRFQKFDIDGFVHQYGLENNLSHVGYVQKLRPMSDEDFEAGGVYVPTYRNQFVDVTSETPRDTSKSRSIATDLRVIYGAAAIESAFFDKLILVPTTKTNADKNNDFCDLLSKHPKWKSLHEVVSDVRNQFVTSMTKKEKDAVAKVNTEDYDDITYNAAVNISNMRFWQDITKRRVGSNQEVDDMLQKVMSTFAQLDKKSRLYTTSAKRLVAKCQMSKYYLYYHPAAYKEIIETFNAWLKLADQHPNKDGLETKHVIAANQAYKSLESVFKLFVDEPDELSAEELSDLADLVDYQIQKKNIVQRYADAL